MNSLSFKQITLLFLTMAGFCFAMDGEEPVERRYYIPFAENTFRGDWNFRLEMGARNDAPYHVSITGYDANGAQVVSFKPLSAYSPFHVFTWETTPAMFDKRLQSIVLTSDQELDGVLWMWNDLLGVVNGVAITEVTASSLVMPHIPSDFFSWRSSFAIMGVSANETSGSVSFGYSNNRGFYDNAGSWTLAPNAYLSRSPFYNILLSDADLVTWGSVTVNSPDFKIAGFQSFLRHAEFQSAAIELGEKPTSEGYFLFTENDAWAFTEMFAFTNPNSERVRIDYELIYRDPATGEIMTAIQSEQIGPLARINKIVGTSSLFPEIEGDYLSLHFTTSPVIVSGESEPANSAIFATHLQSSEDAVSLGAHTAVGKLGNTGSSWISFDERFDTQLDISAFGEQAVKIQMVVSDRVGEPMLELPLELVRGERISFHSDELAVLIQDMLGLEEPPTGAFRVDFVGDGNFLTKSTLFRGIDYAVVNPPVWFSKPEF